MYYKVYANCVRKPNNRAIINIDNSYREELTEAIDKIFENKIVNGSLELKIDNNGDVTDESYNKAYEEIANNCATDMDVAGYIRVGDYMIVNSEKNEIKRPDIIGWGD